MSKSKEGYLVKPLEARMEEVAGAAGWAVKRWRDGERYYVALLVRGEVAATSWGYDLYSAEVGAALRLASWLRVRDRRSQLHIVPGDSKT
jgi:hypothetical protein